MILNENGSFITIDDTNFQALQDAVSAICCLKTGPMD
jgi:hypothetical protein